VHLRREVVLDEIVAFFRISHLQLQLQAPRPALCLE
jgi:hypothetical protein